MRGLNKSSAAYKEIKAKMEEEEIRQARTFKKFAEGEEKIEW